MPIYEYRCPEEHTFELLQGFSEPAPEACAVCGAAPVTKVLSPPAVHFKGSGFYTTDYARKVTEERAPASADVGGKPADDRNGT